MFEKKFILPDNFTVTGHSGCENTPPNSVESIKKAYESGADITEIDIRFREDGIPVLSHDAGNKNAITLDEVFSAAQSLGNMMFNLDIKETTNLRSIAPLAEKYSLTNRIFCTGIFEKDTEEMQKQLPDCQYYLNMSILPKWRQNNTYFEKICTVIKENGAVGLNCNHRNVTKRLVDYLHKENLLVSLWTVDKKKDMKRVLLLSPDNITTRHPCELINLISEGFEHNRSKK